MHALAWGALRRTRSAHVWRTAQSIASIRQPATAASRNFHRSAVAYRIADPPNEPNSGENESSNEKAVAEAKDEDNAETARNEASSTEDAVKEETTAEKDAGGKDGSGARSIRTQRSAYGAARRAARNKKTTEVPPVVFTAGFEDKSVVLATDPRQTMKLLRSHGWDSDYKGFAPSREPVGKGAAGVGAMGTSVQKEAFSEPDAAVEEVDFRFEKDENGTEKTVLLCHESELESSATPHIIEKDVYAEVIDNIKGTLRQRPPVGVDTKLVIRPDIVLQCPKRNANVWLNELVNTVAQHEGADMVRLDPNDLAEIIGTYMGENLAWTWSSYALLGYETHKVSKFEDEMRRDEQEDEDLDGLDGDIETGPDASDMKAFTSALRAGSKLGAAVVTDGTSTSTMSISELLGQGSNRRALSASTSSDSWANFKLNTVLEKLIDSAHEKRLQVNPDSEVTPEIIHIPQYREMGKTPEGIKILKLMRDIVKKRWLEGRQIMILGTTTLGDVIDATNSKASDVVEAVVHAQSDVVFGDHRTIVVTPAKAPLIRSFAIDETHRHAEVNLQHIRDMVNKMGGTEVEGQLRPIFEFLESFAKESAIPAPVAHKTAEDELMAIRKKMAEALESEVDGLQVEVDPKKAQDENHRDIGFIYDLSDTIWPYAQVHRLATIICGMLASGRGPTPNILQEAFHKMRGSDLHKATFIMEQATGTAIPTSHYINPETGTVKMTHSKHQPAAKTPNMAEDMEALEESPAESIVERIRKKKLAVSKREQKLVSGISDTSKLTATFDDVRCPPSTIEALKTLTSLSLSRPDAFSYGVLSKDKIPGVLLYGPPGTGKTLLAKALAKESGVTVLEVSASEIYDKYVGEGEKNVRAVFSLAKKLSPCIVFIDEADSIFAERDGRERASHREIINQFLREWDGMAGNDAFIMIATNRPYDIDEAILRRLPRRLLVDLPVEADREAILKIHLKGETLADDVDLAQIAKNSPFYSGSDLKNVSVAAALACVRDEIAAAEAAAEAAGIPKDKRRGKLVFPEKRVITKKHFDTALQEISASISEDMNSLKAIRKFDEKYGDRKGRKKPATLGFGIEKGKEDPDAALIRKKEEKKMI